MTLTTMEEARQETIAQEKRHAEWRDRYGLLLRPQRFAHGGCVRVLIGKSYAYNCDMCLQRYGDLKDHLRYYWQQDDRNVRLFVSHSYNPLDDRDNTMLRQLEAMGFYTHIGAKNEAWYGFGTFPIVISNVPIPSHHYR